MICFVDRFQEAFDEIVSLTCNVDDVFPIVENSFAIHITSNISILLTALNLRYFLKLINQKFR